jgi:hypothetical protein
VVLRVAELTAVFFDMVGAGLADLPRGRLLCYWRRTDDLGARGFRAASFGGELLDTALRGLAPGEYDFVVVSGSKLGRMRTKVAATAALQRFEIAMSEVLWCEGTLQASGSVVDRESAPGFEGLEVWAGSVGAEPEPWLVARVDRRGAFRLAAGAADETLRVIRRQHDNTTADVSTRYRMVLR